MSANDFIFSGEFFATWATKKIDFDFIFSVNLTKK
jgi:hypothetical protein